MAWFPESERRLLVYGPGWWATAVAAVVLVLTMNGVWRREPWTVGDLTAWITSTGLWAGLLAVIAAEWYRRRSPDDPLVVVQAQVFSGVAIASVGLSLGAVAARLGMEPPAMDVVSARPVWLAGAAIVGIAATQMVTSTRRLIADGQADAIRVAASEREVHLAELAALQQKLEPELLLGTMTAIAARAETAPAEAERAVEGLAAYLRNSLNAPPALTVSLDDDLRRATEYTDIMALAGLQAPIVWRVDPDVRQVPIPSGTLRTFLEYAIARCLRDQDRQAAITVRAYQHAARFYLIVTDTAPPDPPTLSEPEALAALRRRLGAPPQRRVRVETHVMLEVDGTAKGTTQTLMMRLDGEP
jgi:hypothetical protein